MAKYIIRLDDACPTMNHENWGYMEKILDDYQIKPIVGVIPNNEDQDFTWTRDKLFWDRVLLWQNKGWTIAQHGHKHTMHRYEGKLFQLSHAKYSEFAGVPYEKQLLKLKAGNNFLREKGIYPTCFFAPKHTFDRNTVVACKEIEGIKFISDGYGLKPYKKSGMTFLPSICDSPFKMPINGIYTFVFHPNTMQDESFLKFEEFLKKNSLDIISSTEAFEEIREKQGFIGFIIEITIYFIRAIRGYYNYIRRL